MTEAHDNAFPGKSENQFPRPGLTKREYIATAILAGMDRFSDDIAARIAVARADALLKELSK